MWRKRNTFVLKARSGSEQRQHAFTLHVNVRDQDLKYFNEKNATGRAKVLERVLELLDDDKDFQDLVKEVDDLRQIEQIVKSKVKDGTHTLEGADVTVQWQVAEEPGLPNVLQRVVQVNSDAGKNEVSKTAPLAGKYRRLPVRKLAVAVWMYPPYVKIPHTGGRIPSSDVTIQDFFVEVDNA